MNYYYLTIVVVIVIVFAYFRYKMVTSNIRINTYAKESDHNPFMISYTNGILNLKNNEFIKGTPDQPTRLSTRCMFSMDYTWDHPDVVAILDLYRKIYVDKDLNEAWWRLAASCLYGGNPDKIVVFMIGGANTSKSIVINHLTSILGDYFKYLPVKNSQNVRVIGSNTFDMQYIKKISGNDKIFMRHLYANNTVYTPTFKQFIIMDQLPTSLTTDSTLLTRMFVIYHTSRFDDRAPTDKDSQVKHKHFPIDYDITQQLEATKSAMHWILFQKWKDYTKYGLLRPTYKAVNQVSRENEIIKKLSANDAIYPRFMV